MHHAVLYDVSELAVLRPDVLSGTGGLAIVLANLFAATGEERFRDATTQLVRTVHASLMTTLEELMVSCQQARTRGKPMLCGGLVGLGSLLYSLWRCRTALGDGLPPAPEVTAQQVAMLADLASIEPVARRASILRAPRCSEVCRTPPQAWRSRCSGRDG